ncbi:hypothetical protein M422DRAFT_31197 [Sphaerobolus stellatus SS14]|uniref:Uncharacterized protein n=1 Tax=Sphaerobolus stellatus (strain SS14) TaxID=990650 RepID=A0A0C9UIT8_SPHS4|nr:hypothetical protein M422DRAFT_31197 [Sphaerobolus stellatus SS14]
MGQWQRCGGVVVLFFKSGSLVEGVAVVNGVPDECGLVPRDSISPDSTTEKRSTSASRCKK